MRGVYAITNILTDTVYYGQAESIAKRFAGHRSLLTRGRHANVHLQRSWDKHGPDVFVFTPLYLIPDGDMTAREKSCIDGAYGMGLRLFNICVAVPSNTTGRRASVEARAKASVRLRGNHYALGFKHSAETRARVSAAGRGKKHSPEHVEKVAAANRGKTVSAVARAKMSLARIGKPLSEETRRRMSVAKLGVKFTAEHRANMAAAQLGPKNHRFGKKPWNAHSVSG